MGLMVDILVRGNGQLVTEALNMTKSISGAVYIGLHYQCI